MKLFLALILVLMLVGGGFLLLSGTQYRAAEKEMIRAREAATQAEALARDADRTAREATKPAPVTNPTVAEPPKTTPAPAEPPPPTTPQPPAATTQPTPPQLSVDDVLAALPTAPSAPPSPKTEPPAAAPAAPKPDKPATKANDEPQFDVTPSTFQPQDDGTALVDGKYTIKGDGSPENPYVVPWELLTSVEHTYNPAEGKKKIAEAVAMLDGKHVKLNGFIAFPMMVQQPRELLSMLNQWDGCCIGVPPTPYDAVEVRLKEKVTGQKRFMTAGSIVGIFRVKPYLTGKWLVGLWVMDDGEIINEKYGAGGT